MMRRARARCQPRRLTPAAEVLLGLHHHLADVVLILAGLKASAKNLNCSLLTVVHVEDDLTEGRDVELAHLLGMTSSLPLKKCTLAVGPIRKVILLLPTGTVKTSPYFPKASAMTPRSI